MDLLDLILASEDLECVAGVAHDIRGAHVSAYFSADGALAYLPALVSITGSICIRPGIPGRVQGY